MGLSVLFLKLFFVICLGGGIWPVAATEFFSGDYVQIASEKTFERELYIGGISERRLATLGKIGRVHGMDKHGRLELYLCNITYDYFTFGQRYVTKLAPSGGGVSKPQVSTDCKYSKTIITIKQRRFGNEAILKCVVDGMSSYSSVHWVKDGQHLSGDFVGNSSSSRITFSHEEPDTVTLQIKDVKSNGAGWYTCEATSNGQLEATGAVEVEIDHEYTKFKKGDFVQITSDEGLIRELHSHGIGYNIAGGMAKTLGKIGRVVDIDTEDTNDGVLKVETCGTTWFYSTKAVNKLTSTCDSVPEVSRDCAPSGTFVNILKTSFEDKVRLKCTVGSIRSRTKVLWVKDGIHISTDSLSKNTYPRITVSHADLESYTLQITEVKTTDAGWYTCEATNRSGLIATGAVEIKVDTQDTKFNVGDFVQITTDKDLIRRLHSHGKDYVNEVDVSLGKIGRVNSIDDAGDLDVDICDRTRHYSAKAVTKLASPGAMTPLVSSACVHSDAVIAVKKEIVGKSVELQCSVDNHNDDGYTLRWLKGDRLITDASLTIETENSYMVQIQDIKPEDAAWYTCELWNNEDNDDTMAAVGALLLEVKEEQDLPSHETIDGPGAVLKFGDLVRITPEEDVLQEKLHLNGLEYLSGMRSTLGKIGRVTHIDSDGVIKVEICDATWLYDVGATIKLAPAGDSIPEVSTDCADSETLAYIENTSENSNAKLKCLMEDILPNTRMRWVKDGVRISTDSLSTHPRITASPDEPESLTLEIEGVQFNDAGWYTCEVTNDTGLLATRAEEIKVDYEYKKFERGDLVQITHDENWISRRDKYLQNFSYVDAMEKSLGKIGRVRYLESYGMANVEICGSSRLYDFMAVTKLASAGATTPLISSDCVRSRAKIAVQQENIGGSVRLNCSVVTQPDDDYSLKWMKKDEPITNATLIETEFSHIVQIQDVRPDNAGWYTCELRINDGAQLAATGALKLEIEEVQEGAESTTELDDEMVSVGDVVQVLSDEGAVDRLQTGHGGWTYPMLSALGKIGIVRERQANGDLKVSVCGTTWIYNRKAVVKLESSSGDSTPFVSRDCIHTDATIKFKQERVNNTVTVEVVTNNNRPERSYKLRWFKEDLEFTPKRLGIRSENTTVIYTMLIGNMVPEYAGWYSCELRNHEGLAAAGAVKVLDEAIVTPSAKEGEFEVGDVVQVLSDEEKVRKLHEGRVGFVSEMKQTLGKIGKVLRIDKDKDLHVEICGDTLYYHPEAVTKIASAGSSVPKISSKCLRSNATINFKRTTIGNSVILKCTVPEIDSRFIVHLVKGDTIIYKSDFLTTPDFKITKHFEGSSKIYTLKISDVKPEYMSWYACAIVDQDGREAAIGAVKVDSRRARIVPGRIVVGETSSPRPETETATVAAGGGFAAGDVVQVLSDEGAVKAHYWRGIELPDKMRKTLGKIGKVRSIDSDMNLYVEICGKTWYYHPNAVTKLAASGSSAQTMSSNCVNSNATLTIEQKREGDDVILDCTVVNKPDGFSLYWVNKYAKISDETSASTRKGPRVSTSSTPNTLRLLISDIKPGEEDWYTCELKKVELAATASVRVQPRTSVGKIEDTTIMYSESEAQTDTAVKYLEHK